MKKLILIKNNQLAIHYDYQSLYCDFCGTSKTPTFTSSFDDRSDGDNLQDRLPGADIFS